MNAVTAGNGGSFPLDRPARRACSVRVSQRTVRLAGSGALRPTREPTFGPAELVLVPLLVPLTRTAYVQDLCPSARLPLKVSAFDCGFAPVLLAFRQVVAYCAT